MMVTLAAHTPAEEVGICWCPANHPEASTDALRQLEEVPLTLHRIDPPFLCPLYPARLASVIAGFRPDMLHLHGASIGVIGALLGRMTDVPAIVYTEHLEHDRHARWLRWARQATGDLPHRTVYVSHESFRRAVEGGPFSHIADLTAVIHNGIDLSPWESTDGSQRAETRSELGIEEGQRGIGCVGLLWHAKGQEYLIRALARLPRDTRACLVLVGSGPDEQKLRDCAEELGIADDIRFIGWRDDVPRLLGALDLYVQPSLTEGLPLAVVEAAAAGLPIVASEVGGIPEIITSGDDGLLVPPADVDLLAEAVGTLLHDSEQARRLGEAARRTACERFSATAMAEAYVELYNDLLAD